MGEKMLFAIRDDDTCFFTNPEELKAAYNFVSAGPVSLSCVPFAYPYHKKTNPFQTTAAPGYYDIADNSELISFIRKGLQEKKLSIMLHGYSHEYKNVNGHYLSELEWKSANRLAAEIPNGKEHLETLFHVPITTFVSPNNLITQKAVEILEKNNLNYSGTIWKKFGDRPLDRYYIKNYLHRAMFHFKYHMPYSGIYRYRNHLELYAHALQTYDKMLQIYQNCKEHNCPFVVYTHYWDLNQNQHKKEMLNKLYDYVLHDGCDFVSVSDCFVMP